MIHPPISIYKSSHILKLAESGLLPTPQIRLLEWVDKEQQWPHKFSISWLSFTYKSIVMMMKPPLWWANHHVSPCLEAHNHPFGMCSTLTSQSTVPAVKRWRCFAGELAQLVEGSLRSLDKIQRQYDLGNMP